MTTATILNSNRNANFNRNLGQAKQTILTDDRIRRVAPSVFAQSQKEGLSDKYLFIPTTQVMDTLRAEGWEPVFAGQSRAKDADGRDYVKHVLKFERENMNRKMLKEVGDVYPQLILTNSHNGSGSFHINAGLYRLACSNGLVVSDQVINTERIRHTGYNDGKVIEATYRIVEELPKVAGQVQTYRGIELSDRERLTLARSAAAIRWDENYQEQYAEQLLTPRRYGDGNKDLWSTYNVIQENMIRGGMRGMSANRRRVTSRAVNSVSEDMRLNKGLWLLTEEMRKIKTGVA